jgi:hypothetical protein
MIELERRSLRARGLPPQGQRIEISLLKLPAKGHRIIQSASALPWRVLTAARPIFSLNRE